MKKLALITLVLAFFCSALSILLFTAVEFTIIAMLLVFVFREIRKTEVADAGRSQTSSGS